jgi:hypothetical protein
MLVKVKSYPEPAFSFDIPVGLECSFIYPFSMATFFLSMCVPVHYKHIKIQYLSL